MCTASQPNSDDRQSPPREVKPAVKELRSVLKKCPVYLIGPMGSGKSAVGKFLAYEIGFRFLDTDQLIETVAKKTISEIFKESGEESFRELESAVLKQVQQFIGVIVATGGGIVLEQTNWGAMQTGIIVYLKASVDVLVERLKEDTTRPLLEDAEDLRERIETILNDRSRMYEQADVIVPIEGEEPVDDIGNEIIRRLTNFIKSNPPKLSTLYPGGLQKKA